MKKLFVFVIISVLHAEVCLQEVGKGYKYACVDNMLFVEKLSGPGIGVGLVHIKEKSCKCVVIKDSYKKSILKFTIEDWNKGGNKND